MNATYSILYLPINAIHDEKLSIGILMSAGDKHIFKFSSEKLQAIKGIVKNERMNITKSYLNSLEKDINFNDECRLFNQDLSDNKKWINKEYLSYLSKYSTNIIQFSTPKNIDIPLNEENFKWLFEKYVYEFETDKHNDIVEMIDFQYKIKSNLYPAIEKNVNIDITIYPDDLENLFIPIEVNFLGVNGVPVAGQTFDFEKKHHYLENDVSRYVSLTKALELEKEQKGKYYVIGKEPQYKNQKNHDMWKHIRDSDFLEFIDIDEYGIIEDYIKSNDVKPYFEK